MRALFSFAQFGFDCELVAVQRKLNQTEMELETEREKHRKLMDEQTKRYNATDIGEDYILSLHERIAELEVRVLGGLNKSPIVNYRTILAQ